MTNREVAHFTLKQWQALARSEQALYLKTLGRRPSFSSVKPLVPNMNPISPLMWVALVSFFVSFLFTSIKMAAAAGPYAAQVLVVMSHNGYIAPWVETFFTVITALLFIMLATPGLVYFKLLDTEPHIAEQKRKSEMKSNSEWWKVLTLKWITPRLPMTITYLSMGWIGWISFHGGGTVFEIVIPVLVEVGFAQTVADVLQRTSEYRGLVWIETTERRKIWERKVRDYYKDETYLTSLYNRIREELGKIVVDGVRVNAWLEDVDPQTLDDVILAEYRRFTGGTAFSERVQKLEYDKPTVQQEAKRIPPNGATAWTPESLYTDLKIRGILPGYTRTSLLQDYAEGFQVSKAWKDGAKDKLEGAGS